MSNSKFKYFEVTNVQVVRALNKGDATALASGQRGVSGQILQGETWVDRISASEAQTNS